MADSIIPISIPYSGSISNIYPISCNTLFEGESVNLGNNWDLLCITYCICNSRESTITVASYGYGPLYIAKPNKLSAIQIYLPGNCGMVPNQSPGNNSFIDLKAYACTLTGTTLSIKSSDAAIYAYVTSYILYKIN